METCFNNKISYKYAHQLYEHMREKLEVVPDNRVKLIHFDHRREDLKQQKVTQPSNKQPKQALQGSFAQN